MAENSSETKPVSKLEIDRPQDFKFHVAYDVYSRAWDDNTSEPSRARLNELISLLANNESDYSSFYAQIREYRKDLTPFRAGNTRIETQRKKAWQKSDTKDRRNRRYR